MAQNRFDKQWTLGTADISQAKVVNINLFHKSLYSFKNKIEIQSNPFYFYEYPNFAVKIKWWNKKNGLNLKFLNRNSLILSSIHELTYPTMALKYAETQDFLSYSPTPPEISSFIRFKNELLISIIFKKNKICYKKYSIFTFKVGNIKAFKNKSSLYSIDKNLFFFRNTAMFDDKSLNYISLQYDNDIKNNIYYKLNFTYYTIGLNFKKSIFEHKGLFYTYLCKQNKCRLGFGYTIDISSSYKQFSIMPIFSIGYLFKIKLKNNSRNLFKKGIIKSPEENRNMF